VLDQDHAAAKRMAELTLEDFPDSPLRFMANVTVIRR